MPHPFEVREEITLDATPEQVWDAIASGPGIDAWFMGNTEILAAEEGGRTRITTPFWSAESTITAWEPGKRFAYRADAAPDGSFMAFELILEGRDNGSTVLRYVHDGFLGGDNWEDEWDALKSGDRMYLEKLAVYVKYFTGQQATHLVFQPGPQTTDSERVWAAFHAAFGLTTPVQPGDKGVLSIDGLPARPLTVHMAQPTYLIVHTDDSLFLLGYGYMDTVFAEQHSFAADVDPAATDAAWNGWLASISA